MLKHLWKYKKYQFLKVLTKTVNSILEDFFSVIVAKHYLDLYYYLE